MLPFDVEDSGDRSSRAHYNIDVAHHAPTTLAKSRPEFHFTD